MLCGFWVVFRLVFHGLGDQLRGVTVMARFPRLEVDVRTLVQHVVAGLDVNGALFPDPPIAVSVLRDTLDQYIARCNKLVAACAVAERATVAKNVELEGLMTQLKTNLRYAENTVDFEDASLSLLGWAGRAENTALKVPGQILMLTIVSQGEEGVVLGWARPGDGGKIPFYKAERR
jgi:hypothetical protein